MLEHPLLSAHGILAFWAQTRAQERLRHCFGKGWIEVPVKKDGSTYEIPTREVFVRFAPNLSRYERDAVLEHFHLTFVESDFGAVDTVKVVVPANVVDVWTYSTEISRSAGVKYAEPNAILIMSPPTK